MAQSEKQRRKPVPAAGGRPGPSRPAAARAAVLPPFVQRYRGWIIAGVVVAILVAGAVILAIKFGPSNGVKEQQAGSLPADPTVVASLTGIPASTYDAVGPGSAQNPPKVVNGAAPLTQEGKPELLYVGGEYCPFCAAQRWAMIAALSRFGTFSNLHYTHSASNDAYPNTPTFTFYGSQYSSPYVTFTPVEQYTNQLGGNGYTPLQNLTAEQSAVIAKYDQPPYVQSTGAIPFLDFGNMYVLSGATFDPGLLAGKDWSQIVAQLSSPSTNEAKAIDGSANLLAAAICATTGQQPANVCSSQGVTQAAAQLAK